MAVNHPFLSLSLGAESYQILSISYVPGLGKVTLHKLSWLTLITSLNVKYWQPHLTYENTETQRN